MAPNCVESAAYGRLQFRDTYKHYYGRLCHLYIINLATFPLWPAGWVQVKVLHFLSIFIFPILVHSFHKSHRFIYSAHAHLQQQLKMVQQ